MKNERIKRPLDFLEECTWNELLRYKIYLRNKTSKGRHGLRYINAERIQMRRFGRV